MPLFVEGYEGASEQLMKFGVTSQKLEEHRSHAELCIPLIVDEAVVREAGFNPRELQSREW